MVDLTEMKLSELKVKLRPFSTPNFVLAEPKVGQRQDGFTKSPSFHLSELDESTLIEMCDQFKADVLAKSKQDKGSDV